MVKTQEPTGRSCAETCANNGHGSWQSLSAWVSAQPAPTCHCLSFLSLPSPLPPHPSLLSPLISPLSISLSSHSSSFGSPPPTQPPSPCPSFSQQGSSGHCSPAIPSTPMCLPPSTSTSTVHTPLLSERMFQPLHTDSSGILCVEMFLLDPQALTIYRTKGRAPLLKAWHL